MNDSERGARIWDLPVRLFHWLLVIGVVLQFGTAEFGWLSMQWHIWIGYALLALLLFRIAWGFVGSDSARFSHFVTGPVLALRYLRQWTTTPMAQFAGHNPAGGWATVLILALLTAQAISGLFTSDDIDWFGPLCNKAPDSWIAFGTWLHHRLQPVLVIVILVHVLAIIVYRVLKRENLLSTMLHGRRCIDVAAPRIAGNLRALLLLVIAVLLVLAVVWWSE